MPFFRFKYMQSDYSLRSYEVPTEFIGKSLADLRNQRSDPFRTDLVASILGVGERTPFTQGQVFDVKGYNPGSAEYQFLQNSFKAGMSPEQRAVQPAIETLKGQEAPLKDRYNSVIENIRAQRGVAKQKAEVATAQEYGKRGIPLSSGVYDTALQQAVTPVDVQYGGLETGATNELGDRLMGIANTIAQLQAGAGKDSLANQLAREQLAQSQKQFDAELSLQQAQASGGAGMDSNRYTAINVGGRGYIYDKATGQIVSQLGGGGGSSGGGSSNPFGL